jgi:glucose dehydrogenase
MPDTIVVERASQITTIHVLDRASHALLYKVAATTILNQEAAPSDAGERFCPGIYGGSEWNGPAFDPDNQTLVAGQTDWCTTVTRMQPMPAYVPGKLYMGGTHTMDKDSTGWVTAFDAASGKVRWKFHTPAPITSGVTPTAGGVTFVGDMAGTLYALRSSTGEVLRKIDTHGAIAGGRPRPCCRKHWILTTWRMFILSNTWRRPWAATVPSS